MEKYFADLSVSKNGEVSIVEIDSINGSSFEQKLAIAKRSASFNKNIVFYDENKTMIGEVELTAKEAELYLHEKQKQLLAKEAELEQREKALTAEKPYKNKTKSR